MGHCPVNQFVKFPNESRKSNYTNCNKDGCVFIGCINEGVPSIIMVDNSISQSNSILEFESSKQYYDKCVSEKDNILVQTYRTKYGTKYIHNINNYYDNNDISKFAELLLLRNNKETSYYDFYRVRVNFKPENSVNYYKIDLTENLIFPNSNDIKDTEIKEIIRCHKKQHGSSYIKYIINKLKYDKLN